MGGGFSWATLSDGLHVLYPQMTCCNEKNTRSDGELLTIQVPVAPIQEYDIIGLEQGPRNL